ncbi:hypothetical protein [cyanobacterium endosymbiont of Epithemia turgida]|uniref:hypothetical protein n=1 Tax=cyanobacterium endosymbiont of Epithemia turgida TaxID=718217 RepID=UPI0004D19AB6|nr:hypothetical protein [cyanobacterium endosymbiont of Epithemia turgida]BAP17464.1 hypothetical protein ETSB_0632 [cyanobacterium endosymbiont of Epithemia turgida isolate EtSB Lake Yunoko]
MLIYIENKVIFKLLEDSHSLITWLNILSSLLKFDNRTFLLRVEPKDGFCDKPDGIKVYKSSFFGNKGGVV